MHISVHSEWGQFVQTLTTFQRQQLPFATARALTATAKAAGDDVTKSLDQVFDKPTPFTKRAVVTRSATKRNLVATVDLRPVQAAYLRLQEQGGTRSPKGKALVLPAAAKRNQYGNLPAGALARLKARKAVFVGKVRGRGGVWERLDGRRVRLLISFAGSAKYEKRLGYWERIEAKVRSTFADEIPRALEHALRTARR